MSSPRVRAGLCEPGGRFRMEVDLSQVSHRLAPEFLKTIGQLFRQFSVANQEGSEPPFRDKRMVEAENDDLIINDPA
jgi:hypothetical protein